ncbi:MAG: hypothetical protein WCF85_09815 [Rhodospirillaceae bacterium]
MASRKAQKAIDDAYEKIGKIATYMGGKWIPLWKSTNGNIAHASGENVVAFPDGLTRLNKNDAIILAKCIEYLYVGSTHRTVINNTTWRRIYQVSHRNIKRMNADGVVGDWNTETVPCHNCGVIVSMTEMQIDHYMPQEGGNFVTKIFRSLELTTAFPTGGKGQAYRGETWNTFILHPKYRDPGDYSHLRDTTTAANKWTTNDRGNVLLSLFGLVGAISDLERMCKNSLLNLVPLCRCCNGAKSNSVRGIV